jgi:hypothetical protein
MLIHSFSPKKIVNDQKYRRRTMFVLPQTPNMSELEHSISVINILRDLGLEKYALIFAREEIDMEVFPTLSEKDLHEIGIDCKEDIDKILCKVAEYCSM